MTFITPIRSEEDYHATLAEINKLADAETGTEEFARLDALITLVESYEAKICPIEPPDPIDAIEFALDRLALSLTDIAPLLGGIERAEAILTRKRRLTLPMIYRLSARLGIPVAILAQDYPLHEAARRTRISVPKTTSPV